MTIDEDTLEKWKAVFAKDGIKYNTDDEYREAINNLVGFFRILIDIDKNQKQHSNNTDSDKDEMYLLDNNGQKIIL